MKSITDLLESGIRAFNHLTPRTDRCVTSPYNINTFFKQKVTKIKKIINSVCLDITPNSQNKHTGKSIEVS